MEIRKGPYLQDVRQTAVKVCWETDVPTVGVVSLWEAAMPHVPYAEPTVCGEVRQYPAPVGTVHFVEVDGLLPGQTYAYTVTAGEGEQSVCCGPFPFCTAPEADAAVSFAVIAELGGCAGQTKPFMQPLLEEVRRAHPDFIVSVGDLVERGTVPEDWQTCIFTPMKELLHHTPLYPCVGNHEVSKDAVLPQEQDERYRLYTTYFAMPRHYSFDYGCVHICVLDAPSMLRDVIATQQDRYVPQLIDGFEQSEQYRFLEADLAASNAPWKIVVFHYPLYTSSIYDVRELRVLCPLFEKYGVDIVFNSHAIVYERSFPIRNGQVDAHGVRYILPGGFDDVGAWFRTKKQRFSAKINSRPCYIYVAASPDLLELQGIDHRGVVFDTVVIEKENGNGHTGV